MRFEFATAGRILFGAGCLRETGAIARDLGRRALVVTGREGRRAEPLLALLHQQGLETSLFAVAGEPTTVTVQAGVRLGREAGCDLVIALGGGSALDAGKAIAAMLTNPGDLLDYLEVVGRGQPLSRPSAPFIAIPTTAGTGSEVTRNAVLASPEHQVKASLRSPLMLPRVAVVDPDLARDLPPDLTASTGLDALTQVLEPFVSIRANPMTDALCLEGMRRAARSLRKACANGADRDAREDMAVASLFGGLALANAGLGAVHGFAAPIGGMFPAPHGAVCAALLPGVFEMNVRALGRRLPDSDAVRRCQEVACSLTGNPAATPSEAVAWLRALAGDLGIPPLRQYGLQRSDVPLVVERAAQASSMKANPLPLLPEELTEVLEAAL